MNLFLHFLSESRYLNNYQLMKESSYSKSQIYEWLKNGVQERKKRECKPICVNIVKSASEVIWEYPHFGASKGQCYMIYHQLGYIPQHVYKRLKKIMKRLVFQEVSNRKLLPERTSYEHVRPEKAGEIWAEDFTQLRVCGKRFYAALVIDVAQPYYLGATASILPDKKMVEAPVDQALEVTGGKGPDLFMLSDNGSQYIEVGHRQFLDKLSIIQKRIPSCRPEYNGSIECGIKEFKNVFYNVWVQFEESELRGLTKEQLLPFVQSAIAETIRRMNEEIPRPSLKGVTPADGFKGVACERREISRKYLEEFHARKEVMKPWNKNDWGTVKKHLFEREKSNIELMTKFCFFLKRPLRKLANLGSEVLGN